MLNSHVISSCHPTKQHKKTEEAAWKQAVSLTPCPEPSSASYPALCF